MTYATVTTMNQEYFDNIGYQMIESYIKYWPKNINLYVYTENFTLPYDESNVIGLDIFEKCNPNLQKFINGSRTNITRKFSYKAYSWMHACKNLTEDILIWLDADTETIQNVDTKFLDTFLPNNELLAYMYAPGEIITKSGDIVPADNAETCIYFYNNKHNFANEFMQRYEGIYENREIDDKYRFGKPHDTWVIIDCVKFAEGKNVDIINLNTAKKNRTPLKKTALRDHFTHAKGKSKYGVGKKDEVALQV